jgi:hypothetical protein
LRNAIANQQRKKNAWLDENCLQGRCVGVRPAWQASWGCNNVINYSLPCFEVKLSLSFLGITVFLQHAMEGVIVHLEKQSTGWTMLLHENECEQVYAIA